jgi:predicted RNase H-like HicB family nuclease
MVHERTVSSRFHDTRSGSREVSGGSDSATKAVLTHAVYTLSMTFRVVLERDPQTGDYSAVCPELPGCASAGENEEEARANIREAIELYLAPGEIDLPENAKLFEVTVG